jgi:hypothetical protein
MSKTSLGKLNTYLNQDMNDHFQDSVEEQIYEEAWEYSTIQDFEELLNKKGITYVKNLMSPENSRLLL